MLPGVFLALIIVQGCVPVTISSPKARCSRVSVVRGVLGPSSEPDDKPGSVCWSWFSCGDGWGGDGLTAGVGFGGTGGSGGGTCLSGGLLNVNASRGGGGLYEGAITGVGGIGGPGLALARLSRLM